MNAAFKKKIYEENTWTYKSVLAANRVKTATMNHNVPGPAGDLYSFPVSISLHILLVISLLSYLSEYQEMYQNSKLNID